MRQLVRKGRGFVLVTVMLVSVIAIMMTAAIISLNRTDLMQAKHFKERVQALELARAGLNHVSEILAHQPSSTSPVSRKTSLGSYDIRFTGPPETRSINNLSSLSPHSDQNFRGHVVAGQTADIICLAQSGPVRVKVHALLRRGFNQTGALSSVGKVQLDGDVTLNGIVSLSNPQPFGGGITSLHSSSGAGDEAIEWTGSGNFQMLGNSILKTGPKQTSGIDSISANLKSSFPTRLAEGQASEPPPQFDVSQTVVSNSGHPDPDGLVSSGSGFSLHYGNVSDERRVGGDLTVNGDLSLSGGTLYVQGDLTINGGLHGIGSVFVDGNITVLGGNSVLFTNQSKGAALFSSGDIEFTGLDAGGYLQSLASAHPSVNTAFNAMHHRMSDIQSLSGYTPNGANANALWVDVRILSWDQPDLTNYWLNPITGPNGSHAVGSQHSPLPATIMAIKSSLGSSYATDLRAQKVVQALEQTHHNFRFNYLTSQPGATVDLNTYTIPGVSASQFYSSEVQVAWDDDILLAATPVQDFDAWDQELVDTNGKRFNDLALDHKFRASGFNGPIPSYLQPLRDQMFRQVETYFDNHPLDFSWLGDSYFQGIVYAEGDIDISNHFHVVGGVISGGDVSLTGGAELTFDKEYMDFDGSLGPVYVSSYEEI